MAVRTKAAILWAGILSLAACGSDSRASVEAEPCTTLPDIAEAGDQSGKPTGDVHWVDRTRVPTPRIAYAAVSLAGRVHVLGGLAATATEHEIYEPASDMWYEGAALPTATDHAWAAVALDRIYLGDGRSNRVFCYDPQLNRWTEVAASPYRHGRTPTSGVIEGLIYVAGGDGPEMEGSEFSVYDPVEDVWASLPPMQCSRDHSAGGVIAGRLHVVGGRPENDSCHEAYDPVAQTWTRLADLPTARSGSGGAVIGDWLFVIGGEFNPEDPDLVFGTVEAYDPDEDSWMALPDMLSPRHGISAAVLGDTIFLPGGGRRARALFSNDALIVERRP